MGNLKKCKNEVNININNLIYLNILLEQVVKLRQFSQKY